MASKRMFAVYVIDSDLFLDMPLTAQALYFHLCLRADDDGFLNNPKKIQRMVRATDDDMKILIAKQFLIPFDTGVLVIRHWKVHNVIRRDMYKPTMCVEEKAYLDTDDSGLYQVRNEPVTDTVQGCIEDVTEPVQNRTIDKDRLDLDKNNKNKGEKRKRFIPPTVDEVRAYCEERKNGIDPQRFVDFYQSKNWMVGKNKMTDWKASVRTWEGINKKQQKEIQDKNKFNQFEQNKYDFDELEKELGII